MLFCSNKIYVDPKHSKNNKCKIGTEKEEEKEEKALYVHYLSQHDPKRLGDKGLCLCGRVWRSCVNLTMSCVRLTEAMRESFFTITKICCTRTLCRSFFPNVMKQIYIPVIKNTRTSLQVYSLEWKGSIMLLELPSLARTNLFIGGSKNGHLKIITNFQTKAGVMMVW